MRTIIAGSRSVTDPMARIRKYGGNSEMNDTIAGTLFVVWAIVICPIMIAMGGSKDVYVDQIEVANKWCEPHGGLAVIDGTVFQDWLPVTSFKCKDGTRMSLTLAREKKQ